MNLNFILSPWTLFFVALIIIVVMLIFLTLLEKKLKKRITIKKEEQTIYHKKLESLKSLLNNQQRFLIAIDELARDFLSQNYKIDRNMKYSELANVFSKQGNSGAAQFCERIQEALYAGGSANKERLEFLLNNLEFLMQETKKSEKVEKPALVQKKTLELDKRIVEYLREGTKRGFALELLREKLIGAKFTKEEIALAENYLNLKTSTQHKTEQRTESKKELIPQAQKPIKSEDNKFINSLDDLERIKTKISEKSEISGAKEVSRRTGLI